MEDQKEQEYLKLLEQTLNSYFYYHEYSIGKEQFDNFCLLKENNEWLVFYSEYERHDLVCFDNLEEASLYFTEKLFNDNKVELEDVKKKLGLF